MMKASTCRFGHLVTHRAAVLFLNTALLTLGCSRTPVNTQEALNPPETATTVHDPNVGVAEVRTGQDGRPLLVPVVWNGKTLTFLLDTGASRTAFDTSLVTELGDPIRRTTVRTAAGLFEADEFACPDATVGAFSLDSLESVLGMDLQSIRQSIDGNVRGTLGVDFLQRFIVTIDFDQALVHLREPGRFRPDGPRVARSFENSVGLDWLSRFQVSLDFPNRRVMLKRGKRFDEPFSRATSGLAIIDVDGRKFIAQVRPDSPASLAGLSEGDEVVRIGSKQADELDMFTVRKALTENVGEVVTLTIRRGAREFSATIQLADRLN